MPKRGENIYKRKDGRWEGRYIKGRKPDGRPRFGYVYGTKYSDVKAKLLPLKYQYGRRPGFAGFSGTLSEWIPCFMEGVMKSDIKQSTYAYYNGMLQNHILPTIGQRKLHSLTKNEIQGFVDSLTAKGLGSGAARGVFGILNRILQNAVDQNALLVNPCKNVTLPKAVKPNIRILTASEQKKLEQAAAQDTHGIAVLLALCTGMRIGEICALKWEDINFKEGVIHVRRTVQRVPCLKPESKRTEVIFGTPKSENSNRLIPLPAPVRALLTQSKQPDSEYVVSCGDSFAEPRLVRYRYRQLLKKAGIKHVRFHDLRHNFATRCMEIGIDVTTVSRLLGHSSVKMTLDIYTDSLLKTKKTAMHRLDRLFATLPSAVCAV